MFSQDTVAALKAIFAALPEVQRLFCLSRAMMINFERMERHQDLAGMEHLVTQFEKLTAEMEHAVEDIKSWSPTDRQTEAARTLSGYLNDVSPSGSEQRLRESDDAADADVARTIAIRE